MNGHQGFIQIAGFRPSVHWFQYDDKKLAEAVAGYASPLRSRERDGPVEITLGIKHSGTSHLLLTLDQAWDVARAAGVNVSSAVPRRATYSVGDFESVSPIQFHGVEELMKKMAGLKPKSHRGRPDKFDNSQLNKQFAQFDGGEGVGRGRFEHGRVLYRVLRGTLNTKLYGLPEPTWTRSLKVLSLVFNTWARDTRPSKERLEMPMLLDVGWAEMEVPDFVVKPRSMEHYFVEKNRYMSQGDKMMFEHGESRSMDLASIGAKLKEVINDKRTGPVVLLVHDEQITRNALRNLLGVDVSLWETGIKGLLGYPSKVKREASPAGRYGVKRENGSYSSDPRVKREDDEYSRRANRPRSRSRSPKRGIKPDSDGPSTSSRHERRLSSPSRSRWGSGSSGSSGSAHPPVYVIDVKLLYSKMMQSDYGGESVVRMAQRFRQRDEGKDGWCAGNEAVMLLQLWHMMISGLPIDDQRLAHMAGWVDASSSASGSAAAASAVQNPVEEYVDDDDVDPNDIVYNAVAAKAAVPTSARGMYDSDTDYDSDSD
ncbi:hypothetical protein AMATHDRAFT_194582 [Amanita thiersii Skay4041]|uniref:Uncharacterized protein n=1 Tax=Amanita thiersii Skay4041 TaxID=703135 RepID=A0A2A9NPF9_9AGAR|nr:hypothetical protein AMATHDRAFT_194582 [Amanita thiersii Skay4041]